MARKKVKLAWIANDAARRATFKKRKKGIMKKVSELSTLCGVSACAIIYGPYEPEPEVWPSSSDAKRVLARFRSLPDMEQCKKMMNQEEFLRQRITKLKDQFKRQLKDNQEKDNTKLMYQCLAGHKALHELGLETLGDLAWLIEAKIKAIRDRIDLLSRTPPPAPLPPSDPPHPQYIITMPTTMDIRDQKIMRSNTAAATAAATREAKTEGGENNKMSSIEQQVAAMEALHAGQPPWFMDMNVMNHNEHMGFSANEMVMPYVDNNSWSNPFFP
ncbi:hypothetical protein NE237_013347 [Protea cynaroides]|uniref:MADS-box domain-containing protein n=1 Tax=Protea cynaroides TaxID=273540 RepID=A0A9Q0GZP9_9MAGN|nr:hypothetical protein NE237_013347 [Protea cynaroides]